METWVSSFRVEEIWAWKNSKGEDKNWWLSGGGAGWSNRQVRAVSHHEPGVDSVAGAQGLDF